MMTVLFICLGVCFGSFIHVAYCRFSPLQTPIEYLRIITFKRSFCPCCQTRLTIWQLIPIISWLVLKRRCYYCHCKISYLYLFFELLIGILFWVIFLDKGINGHSLILMFFACYFLLLALIDFNYYLLPDFLTQPLMWTGVIFAYFQWFDLTLKSSLFSMLLSYFLLKIPASLFYFFTKKHGLGQGDIKLLVAISAWLSYALLPLLLLLASIFGIIYYLFLRYVLNIRALTVIPFGPFLLISGYIFCYFNQQINDALLSINYL